MAPIVPPTEAVDSLFIKSLEPPPQQQNKSCSNSSLEESAVVAVIRKARRDAQLAFSSSAATPTRFRALHGFDTSKSAPTERIVVEITQCLSEDDANSTMKDKLSSFERDISDPSVVSTWQDKQHLGTHALQTPKGIFWVHGTTFLDVACDIPNNPTQIKTVLSDIAKTLDSYLFEKPVAQSDVAKVVPKLKSKTPLSEPQGATVEIELEKDDKFSTIKRVEFSEEGILIPIELPDTDTVFRFLASKQGKTIVRLVVAHKDTLMVATQAVEVTVTKPAVDPEQKRKDFLAAMEREMGWPSS